MKYKILTVIGTRPNFVKVTQFSKSLCSIDNGIEHKIVHSGQHYDRKMSQIFFEQFGLVPDFWLNVEPASPNTQIANIMLKLEQLIKSYQPQLMLVVGDVNSTLAAALTAHKCNIPLAHVESGLRSSDLGMPEENNRIITDAISNYFFVTEQSGWDNLINEHHSKDKMFFVGNTMIDTLVAFEDQIEAAKPLEQYKLDKHQYVLMTMHRPATVDNEKGLLKLVELLKFITSKYQVVFPIHPRTLNKFRKFNMENYLKIDNLIITDPMGYFSFQKLIKYSKLVITDSGGIQEETTFRKIPCLTLRPNTERPVTITVGTNTLIDFNLEHIAQYLEKIETGEYKPDAQIPKLWDGNASKRISDAISEHIFRFTTA